MEEVDHFVQKLVADFIASQLRRLFTQLVLEGGIAFKIIFHGMKQLVLTDAAITEHKLFDRCKLIYSRSEAGAMDAVVVVLRALGNIVGIVTHQHGLIRRRLKIQRRKLWLHAIRLRDLSHADGLEQLLKAAAALQFAQDHIAHQLGMRYRADVGNVHCDAGNDELPAGRHCVVARVGLIVAHPDQRRNDHIVVGVLREAQPLLGQVCAELIQLNGRVFVHAEVDLRINAAIVQAGVQADIGQLVHRAAAVGLAAAEHQALAVVALLHANV